MVGQSPASVASNCESIKSITSRSASAASNNCILSATRNPHKEKLAPSTCDSANHPNTCFSRYSPSHTFFSEPMAEVTKKSGVLGTDLLKTEVQKITLSRKNTCS
ncbi:hypothetical protein Pcinc_042192 [Petrolisthes cinctipes]|uniref:Uncharacterized protein n=1 Tax=Petrolisthes cinctipes TaxID=88211 RepID=A0AAE1BID3_PETCI|nr:hypothetical protein Pcinc_042192 [Petrolisthes cinctipes]